MAANENPPTERQLHALRAWRATEEALAALTREQASMWLTEFVSAFREGKAHRPDIRERPPIAPPPTTEPGPASVPAPSLPPAPPPPPAPSPVPRLPTTPAPTPSPPVPIPRPEEEEMEVLRKVVFPEATDTELRMVLTMARQLNLDPRRGQIRAFHVGGRPVVSVGIDGYRVIAEDSGQYDGQDPPRVEADKEGKLISATVTVYRRGMSRGVSATAWWDEYARDTPPWRNMPRVMLSKVAEALALRKAFPRGLSGTYTPEEMDQAVQTAPLSPPRVELPGPRAGRPRKKASVETAPEETADPAPVADPTRADLADAARDAVRDIRSYLGQTDIPQPIRDRLMARVRDIIETWGGQTIEDLVVLAADGETDVGRSVVADLRDILAGVGDGR